MACNNAFNNPDNWQSSLNPSCLAGDWAFATLGMISIPTQATPTVTDMHNKPCVVMPNGACDTGQDATIAARDTFSAVRSFLLYRLLTANLVMFGETWSNSTEACNGYPDTTLTQEMVNGYLQSCLYSPGNSGCIPGDNPNPSSVVFRPWGNDEWSGSACETPLRVGAPNGPFKY